MIANRSSLFDHAARHEHELTPRQRDVLRLIAAGRTNAEIGAELAMTFDGAKWNVSEVLTKLGLDSRDEAAAFYRWRHGRVRRAGRWLAGMLPFGPGKLLAAAGLAGTAAVAGVILVAILGTRSAAANDDQPFYLEARMDQRSSSVLYAPGEAPREVWSETSWMTAWSWNDATHQRAETTAVTPAGAVLDEVAVADGTNVYHQLGAAAYDRSLVGGPGALQSLATHAPRLGHIDAATVEELIDQLREHANASRAGESTILGRRVEIIEIHPTELAMGADGRWVESGTGRLFVDPERMFVMRYATTGTRLEMNAEVTLLRYGEEQAADRFVFAPRSGTTENQCVANGSSLPAGFLAVPEERLPSGLVLGPYSIGYDSGTGTAICLSLRTTIRPASLDGDERFISIEEDREHPDFVLPIERDDVHVLADGTTAYARVESPTLVSLAWVRDGLGVLLRTNVLDVEGLVVFANGMIQ